MTRATEDKKTFRLKTLVNLMTFLSNHQNAPVETVCSLFAMTPGELTGAIYEILMCGLPPYTPSDYVSAWVEDGSVGVSNADFLRRPLGLTVAEAVSIKVMLDDFMRQSPGVFEDAAATLSEKLHNLIARRAGGGTGAPQPAAKMVAIEAGLGQSRLVEISYYSRAEDALAWRKVEPLAVVDIDGVWYLVAFCRLRSAERAFRIDRIREARLLDERFSPRKDFRIDDYRRSEMFFPTGNETRVTVRFGRESARWARERFGDNVAADGPDGSVTCEFPVADFAWMSDLVTEFGGDARIIEPAEAVEAHRKRLEAVLALYERPQ